MGFNIERIVKFGMIELKMEKQSKNYEVTGILVDKEKTYK
jgi:hypothetical protein